MNAKAVPPDCRFQTGKKVIMLCFENFSALWLDWVKDEISIATTDEEKKNIILLFEKAVKDYLSNYN